MTTSTSTEEATVRFGRRQSKGVLLGFSGPRLLAIGLGIGLLVTAMVAAGEAGLLRAAPVWASLFAVAFVRWNGAPLADAAPVLVLWGARTFAGQTRYRVKAAEPRLAGRMSLPGEAAALRFHLDEDSGAAMIHDPHRQTLSAVVHVSHPAYVLLSPDEQARRVAGWSRVLAGLAATGCCAGVQILESTLPDPGDAVRDWYAGHGRHDQSWPDEQYQALMTDAAPSSCTHRTLLVLTLDLKAAARLVREAGRGMRGAAQVLRSDMTTCEAALRAADLKVDRWLGADALAAVVRAAYDPDTDNMPQTQLAVAGPVAIDEHWDHLRHDTAFSTVLWISEWPRIDVAPHFLHSLVFLQDVRKSVSIIAKPLGTGEALRSIRKEKVEYLTEAQQSDRIGKIADLSADQEYNDVLARERALISGHADLRFSGFIAVTAPDRYTLRAAVAATQRAATQSGCETRILLGQQAQAFTVAALPLGRAVHR